MRINNPKFKHSVGNLKGGIEFLLACGFEYDFEKTILTLNSTDLSIERRTLER